MTRNKFINLKNALFFNARTDFVKYFLKNKKIKLLDVGNLGDGVLNVDFRKLIEDNGGEYFGLDCNENLADSLGYKNQLIGDLHHLSNVSDETFDFIYAGQIIEHSWSPGKMIKECSRVLKKEGYLIIDTPNAYDLIRFFRIFFKKKDTIGMDDNCLAYNEAKDNFIKFRTEEKRLLSQPQHKIFYGPAMLRQLLNMHGFKIETYAFIGKPKNLLHKILLKIFPTGSQMLGVLAKKEKLENIFDISNNRN